MWVSYLPQVDTVLMVVVGEDAVQELMKAEKWATKPLTPIPLSAIVQRWKKSIKRYPPRY